MNKIKLREWTLDDAANVAAIINNKKVIDNLRDGIPYPYTEKDAAEFITATLNAEKGSQYAFAITYDGQVIGSIGVFRKEGVHRFTAELGYYIGEKYWGKGIMTEAVKQICDFVFDNTDIVRIYAEPYAYNTASCRVLEKAGFQFEGTLRQNVIKNGQTLDMKLYAILKPPAIRPLNYEDIPSAIDMVWNVFLEFEAPEYSDEGIAEFKAFIEPDFITKNMKSGEFKLWGAFDNRKIIGVIATKPPLHIALLFVDKQYHRRGIARKMFETVLKNNLTENTISVNSSPYAVEIYHRLGFVLTDTEQTVNGIRFTPMEYSIKKDDE